MGSKEELKILHPNLKQAKKATRASTKRKTLDPM
jgi:hypothetical protein